MEPYYDHHPSKQFIRGKPIRFGYKQWCMVTAAGYLVKYGPYTGKNPRPPGLGLGGSVVKMFGHQHSHQEGRTPRLHRQLLHIPALSVRAHCGWHLLHCHNQTGQGGASSNERSQEGSERDHDVLQATNGAIRLLRWQDNSEVTFASNKDDPLVLDKTTVKQWSMARQQAESGRTPAFHRQRVQPRNEWGRPL